MYGEEHDSFVETSLTPLTTKLRVMAGAFDAQYEFRQRNSMLIDNAPEDGVTPHVCGSDRTRPQAACRTVTPLSVLYPKAWIKAGF